MFKKILNKLQKKNIRRPNVVMILLDQFRNDARKAHDVFEELGRRGVLFSNTITYAPYTIASLHATFTGMYGRENGVDAYTKSDQYRSGECYSLPEYFKDRGYYTRGYTFSDILFPKEGFDQLSIVPEKEETDILKHHLNELDMCYRQNSPFFCFLHYGDIHHEIVKEVIRKYTDFDEEYFGKIDKNMARYMEHAQKAGEHTKKLLRAIEMHDPNHETMVIVFTDHGGGIGEKPGEKSYGIFTYDYSICIWVYFVLPGVFPNGKEYDVQIRTIDILPTLIDILGSDIKKRKKSIMGRSLWPIIKGEEFEDRVAFTETGGVEGPHPSPSAPNVKCLRDGRWKLILNSSTNQYELYDLNSDPDESINLYGENPEKAEELLKKMIPYL